ncbi:GGDEF domain-containing protein [Jiella sp. M17.18]
MVTAAIDKIEAFVKFDPLTGALARNYFLESARQAMGRGGAVLLVDADHFKRINDSHGHDVGDKALQQLGATLACCVPPDALVGRIGGEEFAVFLPAADQERIEPVAAGICRRMRTDGRVIAERRIGLTVSIGGATITPGSSLQAAMKRADDCLYAAKAAGRDCFVISQDGR